MDSGKKVTAEFYSDALLTTLVGAVDVPAKRMVEAAETIGKTICRVLHLSYMETIFIGPEGESLDRMVVHR